MNNYTTYDIFKTVRVCVQKKNDFFFFFFFFFFFVKLHLSTGIETILYTSWKILQFINNYVLDFAIYLHTACFLFLFVSGMGCGF